MSSKDTGKTGGGAKTSDVFVKDFESRVANKQYDSYSKMPSQKAAVIATGRGQAVGPGLHDSETQQIWADQRARQTAISELQSVYDYINSGKTDTQSTSKWLDIANDRSKNVTDEGIRGEWMQLANQLNIAFQFNHMDEYQNLLKNREYLDRDKKNKENEHNSVTSTLNPGGNSGRPFAGGFDFRNMSSFDYNRLGKYGYHAGEQAEDIQARYDANEAAIAAKEEEIFQLFAPQDVKDARQRLTDNKYIPGVNEELKLSDDELVNNWLKEWGFETRKFNNEDRFVEYLTAGAGLVKEDLTGLVGTMGRGLEEASEEAGRVREATSFASVNPTVTEDRWNKETPVRMIGGEAIPSLAEIEQDRAYAQNLNEKDILENGWISGDMYLASKANKWANIVTDTNAELDSLRDSLAELDRTADSAGFDDIGELARQRDELTAKIKQKEKDAKDAQEIVDMYGGSRASLEYAFRNGDGYDFWHVFDQMSWDFGDKARDEIREANKGASKLMQQFGQATTTAVQIGFDTAVSALTGGVIDPKVVMALRVFGSTSQHASRKGASTDKSIIYGALNAGIEYFTESMFGLAGGLIYGKGFADDFAKQFIHRMELSPFWEAVLGAAADVPGEALEEGASAILGIVPEMILNYDKDKSFKENFRNIKAEQLADIWYEMFMGGFIALLGTPAGAITGQYSNQVSQAYVQDAANTMRAQEEKAAADKKAMDEALASGDEAKVQAVIDQAGGVPQSEAYKVLTKVQQLKQQIETQLESDQPITVQFSRREAAIARSMGLIDKNTAKYLQEPTERQKKKAQAMVDKSSSKSGKRRETIISNAEKEGVKTKSDRIREEVVEDEDADMLPPMPEGPQSAKEAIALEKAKAKDQEPVREKIADIKTAQKIATSRARDTARKMGRSTAGVEFHALLANEYVDMVANGELTTQQAYDAFVRTTSKGEAAELFVPKLELFTGEEFNPQQESAIIAPEEQPTQESTPVAPEEEKTVKPDVKPAEQAAESKPADQRSEALKIIQDSAAKGEDAKEAVREEVRKLVPEWDDAKFDRLWDYSKPYSKPEKSEPELKREATQDAIEVALSFVRNGANPFRGQPVDVKPETLEYMKTASANNPIVIGEDSEHAYIFDGTYWEGIGENGYSFTGEEAVHLAAVEIQRAIDNGDISTNDINIETIIKEAFADDEEDDRGEIGEEWDFDFPDIRSGLRRSETDANKRRNRSVYEFISRAPESVWRAGPQAVKVWAVQAALIEKEGGRVLSQEELPEDLRNYIQIHNVEKQYGCPITFYDPHEFSTTSGFMIHDHSYIGSFIAVDLSGNGYLGHNIGTVIFHEDNHIRWETRGKGKSRKEYVLKAFEAAGADVRDVTAVLSACLKTYGADAITKSTKHKIEKSVWTNFSPDMRVQALKRLAQLDPDGAEKVIEYLYEEVSNWLISGDKNRLADYPSLDSIDYYMAYQLVQAGLYDSTAETDSLRETTRGLNKLTEKKYNPIMRSVNAEVQKTSGKQMFVGNALFSEQDMEDMDQHDLSAKDERRAQPAGKKKQSKRAEQEKTQVKPAIANAEERAKEVAEKFGVSDGTYISLTREKVSEIAKYWIKKFGQKNEYNRLIESKQWNRVDFSEAGKIAYDMTMKLNHDMTDGRRGLGPVLQRLSGESYEDYRARQKASDDAEYQRRRAEIDALLAAYSEQKSIAGQNLQEQYKYSVADEIRIRASKRFLSYSENGEVHNTDWSINTKLWNVVDDLLTRMEAAEAAGNTQEMVELTKMVSRIRSRQNMFGKAGVKAENFMFNRMMKFGLDADKLATLAYGNINKIMDDITPISYADAIESVRMTNMLSNIATGVNNILNNAVSARTGSIAQNASIPFAKAFEKITGKKVAVADKSLIRDKEIFRAEEVAYEYAVLSAYYGLNTENGRLDVRGTGGTFSVMDGGVSGFVERALARYNFLVSAFVLSPDAPVKARVQTGIQKGIDKAFEGEDLTNKEVLANKHELEGFAAHEAKRRTLQDDNRFTNAVLYVKQHLLGAAKTPGAHKVIKGRELGSLDLGQFMIAFAKVPTNVGIQKVAATPYGTLYHVAQYAYTLAKAKADPSSVSVMEMAKASRNVGRAATTWGSIALGALAAATGALKNFDDTDDDEEKKLAAEKGYKGLMLNLSELFRPGNEWKDGDLILNANFLEILATPLSIGAMMYDARQEGAGRLQAIQKGTWESFTGMVDAIMEIPGLQQVGELYQAFANRDPNDGDFKSAVKAIGQFSVNTGTSYFLPNIVSQATAGWDNTQRDIYSTNSYGETLRNIVMAKIPGLRQKLPEKTDALGNTRTYGENRFMSIINTVLLPGDIKRYHISELEKELMRIKKETGYSGTFIDTKGPRKIEVGDNEYALDADQRRAFHETKAKYIAEAYDAFRTSDIYHSLTDEQRLDVYKSLRMDAERMTKNEALELANVDDRVTMDKWETELDLEGKIQYLSVKQMAGMYWDKSENSVTDFSGMDAFLKGEYKNLSEAQKKLLNGSYSHLDDLAEAAKNGINSEKWQAAYNIYQTYTEEDENGKRIFKSDLKNESQMWSEIQQATGFSDSGREMRHLQNTMELTFTGSPNTATYDELIYDYGLSRESAAKIYNNFSTIQPTKGYADVQDRQKWVGLTKCGLSDNEQWDSFFAMVPSNNTNQIKNMRKLQNQINPETGNKYTFKEAIHRLKLDVIYWKEVLPNGKEKKHEIK